MNEDSSLRKHVKLYERKQLNENRTVGSEKEGGNEVDPIIFAQTQPHIQ